MKVCHKVSGAVLYRILIFHGGRSIKCYSSTTYDHCKVRKIISSVFLFFFSLSFFVSS